MNAVPTTRQKAVVAMSGGVDSSVAALLLARQGYEVVGITMRLFEAPFEGAGRLSRSCCSLEDVQDARAVCRIIGARHYYMNFEKEFRKHVIDYFVSEYERGRTPFPCLACNDRLKFNFLMNRAVALGADYVATGHYAQVRESAGSFRIERGADSTKDQSYVLYTLTQGQLSRLLLPTGGHTKDQIRQLAADADLPVADKPDSQDICFIPAGNYKEFVEPRLESKSPGNVVDGQGRVLGEHDGVHKFTVGQRRGLPLNGGSKRPLFVTGIDAASGTVTVGPAEELAQNELTASGVNWISGHRPDGPIRVTASVRYRGREQDALVTPLSADRAVIEFDEAQRAVTPGQAVVFYDGVEVLGGGIIEHAGRPAHDDRLTAAAGTV